MKHDEQKIKLMESKNYQVFWTGNKSSVFETNKEYKWTIKLLTSSLIM